ncbi:ATP-binding protein [Polyangium jinanense]|uniref:histidine kinase n=1 Tax=Polyangium jinanense TaxID=2829994 RepID=A0A9X3X1Y3_9BACT|nr:ATP-binding protein [Polyangium jinanense]MDC3980718.1 Hpt domain-containing protein [Polyangium jinanense]
MTADRELTRLLFEEIQRHAPLLEGDALDDAPRRAIHALKGSAGVAGERALFESLARIERRLVDGDTTALVDARAVLSIAGEALAAGRAIPAPAWPEPPWDLRGRPAPPEKRARYAAEMTDRLARVDELLSGELPEPRIIAGIFREVHAMKAAALAAGDDATAWFCHGLEDRARDANRSDVEARRAIAEIARWRGLLGELVAAPDRAVEVLRRLAYGARSSTQPPPSYSSPEPAPHSAPEPSLDPHAARLSGETLRVSTAALDRLLDRVRSLERAESAIAAAGRELGVLATRARRVRSSLAETRGPHDAFPRRERRLRKATAAVAALSDALDAEAATLLGIAERSRFEAASAHADIALMRTTPVATLFDRVVSAAIAQARRLGRDVRVLARGGETLVDRRVAEGLFDPLLQLVQNSIVHGIEPETTRAHLGKPLAGRVEISAEQRGASLRIVVRDDGSGVDIERVRSRAVTRGAIASARAVSADHKALLGLLFVPGFTLRENVDLLAGRGLGLGLVRESVRRLGGTVRLASRPSEGLTATLDVPLERGLVRVLWVRAGEAVYAIPARLVRRISFGVDLPNTLAFPLAACVRGLGALETGEALGPDDGPSYLLELDPGREDEPSFFISVTSVGEIEDASLHPAPPLVALAGPYNGAIVRGDAVRLCLDVHALAELVYLIQGRRAP